MRDLISRETAKLTLKNYGLNRYMLERMERWIDAQPAVDAVSVVHGEWLPFEYGDDTWHKCSVCGIADKYKGSMPRPNKTIAEWEYVRNYCPNCGARMKGEDDE